jgi:hypothetical protein
MKGRVITLVVLATAVALASGAGASHNASKQRVAITARGLPDTSGKFVLDPVQAGALRRDSGTETSAILKQRVRMRAGQRVTIVTWLTTLKGSRGSLVFRSRLEDVDAGNRYHVGVGTWKVVRGSGQYARVTGGGRIGNMWRVGPGTWSERREGFLRSS